MHISNPPTSFFEGLPPEDLARILGRLERRRYPAGSIMLVEGESVVEMYIVQEGLAEVMLSDHHGSEHLLSRIGPGGTLGEMALFTDQPASATVRAISDVEVLVFTRDEFERLANRLPIIYRNLGAILSRRLSRTNSRWLRAGSGRSVLLQDAGAPPLLGYALACSVAWHTRKSTLFVSVWPDEPPAELLNITGEVRPPELANARSDGRRGIGA